MDKELQTLNVFGLDEEKIVSVLHLQQLEIIQEEMYSPHTKENFAIRIMMEGKGKIFMNYIPTPIKKGHVSFDIPGDVTYFELDKKEPISAYVIAFRKEFLDLMKIEQDALEFGQTFMKGDTIILNDTDLDFLVKLASLIKVEYGNNPNGTSNKLLAKLVESCLYFIVQRMMVEKVQKVSNRDNLEVYKSFINQLKTHFTDKHFVADYTEMLFIHEKKLNRICQKITGLTALQVIHKFLDQEIKTRLVYTDLSVKEISQQLGFNDPTHLYKFFKKMNKVTPMTFKKSIKTAL